REAGADLRELAGDLREVAASLPPVAAGRFYEAAGRSPGLEDYGLWVRSFGSSTHIFPRFFIRPATASASGPKPQKTSPRIGPRMAPPVSWATRSRRSLRSGSPGLG